ncbi:hypothetical protein L195_g052178 [Trifolium pratense]|uniref:Uncharacterized protein n=1 Tax=Trifolium pratense TaxID=57577 RepID=A0A2K3K3P5_TRIPR|nr:hypothetical protein L195_g052178 [Trifolium pratense]
MTRQANTRVFGFFLHPSLKQPNLSQSISQPFIASLPWPLQLHSDYALSPLCVYSTLISNVLFLVATSLFVFNSRCAENEGEDSVSRLLNGREDKLK